MTSDPRLTRAEGKRKQTNPNLGGHVHRRDPCFFSLIVLFFSRIEQLLPLYYSNLIIHTMADDATHLSASQSQLSSSSSSASSLSPAKLCSRTYKKASQLYLTRRLHESLTALEPVITPSQVPDDSYVNGDASTPPIAAAPNTWRIKVWNLYITLLSAIVELGPEEGRKLFGQKEWKAVSSQVRDGGIWETVVQTGYRGLEGSVDAEVVYNLYVLEDLSLV